MSWQAAFLAYWRARQRWHRYRVVGIEHLDLPRAALIVGYHGRPVAADACMLAVSLHDRLGYLPHGIVNRSAFSVPGLAAMSRGLGLVAGDGLELEAAVAKGEHVFVQPGGVREAARSFRVRYRVDWGERLGYLRLAKRRGMPLVPIAASGVDDVFVGLNDGYTLGRRLGLPEGVPPWLGVGLGGVWPVALPLPVTITQHVGPAIHLDDVDADDLVALREAHVRVQRAVQDLLDRAIGRPSERP